MDKPMVIVVDRHLQSMYANWSHEVFGYSLSIAILALLLTAALFMHQRQRRLAAHAKAQSEAERKTAVEALRQGEERFRNLIKLSSDWHWEQDEQFRFVRLPGDLDQKTRSANDAHVGKTRWEMGAVNLNENDWKAHRIALESHQEFHDFEMLRNSQDGSPRWTSVSGMPVFDTLGNFTGYRGVARDVTANKLSEEHIKRFAFYDGLTKLPNRRFLKDRMTLEFAASKRTLRHGAVLFLDLDNFKPLNDKFGHDFGDLLLIEVAVRLVACVREVDTVARFGGDEFVVVIGNLDLTRDESMDQARRVAEKIRLSLAQPYRLLIPQEASIVATVEHRCTVSIGVTLFFNHEQTEEAILKQADTAMYNAKEAGGNSIRFYEIMVPD
jgi:diguanylate cyclase (GGDEF)-like protein/PAS domain S-box-containing protein